MTKRSRTGEETAPSNRQRRRWPAALVWAIAGTALTGSSGCTTVANLHRTLIQCHSQTVDDAMIGFRNRSLSGKAWHRYAQECGRPEHLAEFRAGFRQGYEDVAGGGDGCTPIVAPRRYWGWRYQSPDGQAQVAAWFAGYPHGAAAAERDGISHWSQVPTSLPATASIDHYDVETGVIGTDGTPPPLLWLDEASDIDPQPEVHPGSNIHPGSSIEPESNVRPDTSTAPELLLESPPVIGNPDAPRAVPEHSGDPLLVPAPSLKLGAAVELPRQSLDDAAGSTADNHHRGARGFVAQWLGRSPAGL